MKKKEWLETLKKTRALMTKEGWDFKKEKDKDAKKTR
jgi:hypothetical protein